jgi:phytoene dehydrogenase-like protein
MDRRQPHLSPQTVAIQAAKMTSDLRAIVVGAGIGGLATAIQLGRPGMSVRVLEARPEPGGLASGFTVDGFSFDYGPYILLDRPGLEWAFEQFGERLTEHLVLRKIDDIYQVTFPNDVRVRFYSDLGRTASEFERLKPGSARKYVDFVHMTNEVYGRLSPLLHVPRPGLSAIIASGAWRDAAFLLSSLEQVLRSTQLPAHVVDAIGIWTHVAGQSLDEAPSPLAFVPSLFHTVGCYVPAGGIRRISQVMAHLALACGVEFEFNCRAKKILTQDNKVTAVETETGALHPADIVVSNHSAIGTYVDLLDREIAQKSELEQLPLQSPGVCAYLAVHRKPFSPYLHFYLPNGREPCRLLINAGLMEPEAEREGWYPARLLSPLRYSEAQNGGAAGQRQYLEKIMKEAWWKPLTGEARTLAAQIPEDWGHRFNLYRGSMNPAMTAQFMRAGRMPHRSPHVRGLYFAGSSTHPGQWVSFCAISGILAARCVLKDFKC